MPFKRIITGLTTEVTAAHLREIAQMAQRLGAEISAALVADTMAAALAAWPQARAYDAARAQWRALETAALADQFGLAIGAIEREVLGQAAALGVAARFSVLAGIDPWRQQLSGDPDQLIVVPEPATPPSRWLRPFVELVDVALSSGAPLLYLPQRLSRGRVIAAVDGDHPHPLAAELARLLDRTWQALETHGGFDACLRGAAAAGAGLLLADRRRLPLDARAALFAAADLRLALLLLPVPEGR
jgi:hypothetical protein